jgi:sigma-B regulation protein RsbU (phosphoserine phosphatase)
MQTAPRVLIADDQSDVLEALRLLLKPEGFTVEMAASPKAVLDAVGAHTFDAVLIDLNYARDTTSGQEGLRLLADLQALVPDLPVIVMTAWGSIGLAVEAMRRGAADFVTKPWDNARLVATLRTCLDRRQAEGESRVVPAVGQRELSVARAVQKRLLPQSAPQLPTLRCAADCEESGPVGGDFYDFLDLGSGRLGIVVADVSGKGVPAAIVMAHLSATLRSLAPQMREDLGTVSRRVNALLLEATASHHYVTLFLATYDEATRQLRYANCGHPPPILRRAGGKADWLPATAPAVGLFETFQAGQEQVPIDIGDTLLVYSDGLTETWDRDGVEFGADRIAAFLQGHPGTDPETLVTGLLEERRTFGSGTQPDDVTVLVAQGR